MTAGLIIQNDSGNVQIDETYRNMHLRQKTSCVGLSSDSVIGTGLNNPIFAIWSSFAVSLGSSLRKEFSTPSTWHLEHVIPSGQTIEVFAFDIGAPLAADNFGLVIYDASGNLVFHSSGKPLVVPYNGTVTHAKNTTADYTFGSGRKYAVIPLAPHPGYTFNAISDGFHIAADNGASTPPSVPFLAVDVTPY